MPITSLRDDDDDDEVESRIMTRDDMRKVESGAKLCNINYDGGCNFWLEAKVKKMREREKIIKEEKTNDDDDDNNDMCARPIERQQL